MGGGTNSVSGQQWCRGSGGASFQIFSCYGAILGQRPSSDACIGLSSGSGDRAVSGATVVEGSGDVSINTSSCSSTLSGPKIFL